MLFEIAQCMLSAWPLVADNSCCGSGPARFALADAAPPRIPCVSSQHALLWLESNLCPSRECCCRSLPARFCPLHVVGLAARHGQFLLWHRSCSFCFSGRCSASHSVCVSPQCELLWLGSCLRRSDECCCGSGPTRFFSMRVYCQAVCHGQILLWLRSCSFCFSGRCSASHSVCVAPTRMAVSRALLVSFRRVLLSLRSCPVFVNCMLSAWPLVTDKSCYGSGPARFSLKDAAPPCIPCVSPQCTLLLLGPCSFRFDECCRRSSPARFCPLHVVGVAAGH
jgi:hypothetical protein